MHGNIIGASKWVKVNFKLEILQITSADHHLNNSKYEIQKMKTSQFENSLLLQPIRNRTDFVSLLSWHSIRFVASQFHIQSTPI